MFAAVCLVLGILVFALVKDFPEQAGAYPDNDKSFDREAAQRMPEEGLAYRKVSEWQPKRFLKTPNIWRIISFIGIGGSDWACRVQTDHAMVAMSPAWKVIDNEFFMWSKDIIMNDEAIERVGQIGRNLAEAAADIEKARYMGEPGVCPHCNCSNFWLVPGTTKAVCELCGLEGEIQIEDGAYRFVFKPEDEHKAHDTISGKFLHVDDIRENEGRLMNLYSAPEYKRRVAYYKDFIQPTPPPAKG